VCAFAVYRRIHDSRARLTLVGGQSAGLYWRALHKLVADLDVADAVTFTDVVTQAELIACYRSADVLLCLSEHEGFNVPVVEAMHFDVPVVAYAASAVPDTVGDAGLLLTDQSLVEAGRKRAEHFSIERTGPHWIDTLTSLMKETGG
jgi:L-malate glycosyltransferase